MGTMQKRKHSSLPGYPTPCLWTGAEVTNGNASFLSYVPHLDPANPLNGFSNVYNVLTIYVSGKLGQGGMGTYIAASPFEPRHESSNNVAFWACIDSDEPVQPPFKVKNSK